MLISAIFVVSACSVVAEAILLSDLLFERLRPSQSSSVMYAMSIECSTRQYQDINAYEALCKASAAGYTCVDTANSDRQQKRVGRAVRVSSTQSRPETTTAHSEQSSS